MSNKHRGYTEIILDKPRHLRYDVNALAEIEELLGISSITLLNKMELGVKAIRIIVWAGLLHEDAVITQKDVGSWIDGDNLQYVMERLSQAMSSAFGGQNTKKTERGTEAAGIGITSSSLPTAPSDSNRMTSGN